MIRDGEVVGGNITILEELAIPGARLDAAGSAKHCYVLRSGRTFEKSYLLPD